MATYINNTLHSTQDEDLTDWSNTSPQIFISHCKGDATATAHFLKCALATRGLLVCTTADLCRHYYNYSGSDRQRIENVVRQCGLVVLLGTEEYGCETICLNSFEELNWIIFFNKRVFLIKMCHRFQQPLLRFKFPSTYMPQRIWIPTFSTENILPFRLLNEIVNYFHGVLSEILSDSSPQHTASIHHSQSGCHQEQNFLFSEIDKNKSRRPFSQVISTPRSTKHSDEELDDFTSSRSSVIEIDNSYLEYNACLENQTNTFRAQESIPKNVSHSPHAEASRAYDDIFQSLTNSNSRNHQINSNKEIHSDDFATMNDFVSNQCLLTKSNQNLDGRSQSVSFPTNLYQAEQESGSTNGVETPTYNNTNCAQRTDVFDCVNDFDVGTLTNLPETASQQNHGSSNLCSSSSIKTAVSPNIYTNKFDEVSYYISKETKHANYSINYSSENRNDNTSELIKSPSQAEGASGTEDYSDEEEGDNLFWRTVMAASRHHSTVPDNTNRKHFMRKRDSELTGEFENHNEHLNKRFNQNDEVEPFPRFIEESFMSNRSEDNYADDIYRSDIGDDSDIDEFILGENHIETMTNKTITGTLLPETITVFNSTGIGSLTVSDITHHTASEKKITSNIDTHDGDENSIIVIADMNVDSTITSDAVYRNKDNDTVTFAFGPTSDDEVNMDGRSDGGNANKREGTGNSVV
eukprot:gene5144-8784_t